MENKYLRKNNEKEYSENFAYFYDMYLTGLANEMAIFYLSKLDIEKGTILDLMCGTGTLLNTFNSFGWSGTGVDISNNMLSIAEQKNKEIKYYQQDVTEFKSLNTFDVVTCTADAINHLPSLEDIKKVFSVAYTSLKQDGYFLFDMNTEYGSILNEVYVSSQDENGLVIRNGLTDLVHKIGYTKFSGFIKDEKETYLRFDTIIYNYIYKIKVILEIIKDTGFEVIEIFDADNLNTNTNTNKVDDMESLERVGFIVKKNSL